MSELQPARGTHDLLPEAALHHRWITSQAQLSAERFGFKEMHTPIFEFTHVFSRTLGDLSDIVSKEMYCFEDRGGDSLTLRPEGTAGIARAFLSNGLRRQLPLKYFYHGPMFRRERPQKGRQRQFHQLGVELLGVDSPQADIEVISLAHNFLESLNLKASLSLEINTLGSLEDRKKYRAQLVSYYEDHKSSLSEDSLRRLQENPLRILDSKDKNDQKINESAPSFDDSLSSESKDFFAVVTSSLDDLKIPYKRNTKLVRGLDYYGHTVFEVKCGELGAQNTVLAGGRYDGLIEIMGGPKTPGIGWASGIERLALLTPPPKFNTDNLIAIIPSGEETQREALILAHELRQQGFQIEMAYSGNMKKRLQKANKWGAALALLIGPEELQQNKIRLKDLKQGHQEDVPRDELISVLKRSVLNSPLAT